MVTITEEAPLAPERRGVLLARSHADVEAVRGRLTKWRKLSDKLFTVFGHGVGLDGLLTFIPGVGGAYSLSVGAYLVAQAVHVRASKSTLAKMGALLALDSVTGEIPLAGDAFDIWLRAHARMARALERDMERTHYVAESRASAVSAGRLERHQRDMHNTGGKRRVVFLGD